MKRIAILLVLMLATACGLWAQADARSPLTQKELTELLKGGDVPAVRIAALVTERGVSFDLTPDIEKKLRKAKADDQLIELVKNSGPTARQHQLVTQSGAQITQPEFNASQAIQNELDPDRAIQLAKEFANKYPASALLSDVYFYAAASYYRKNEAPGILEFANKSLEAKPDNLRAMLILVEVLPQPQVIGKMSDADREKTLARTESLAAQALQLIDQIPKQAGETDEQFEKRKAVIAATPHSALGMVHLARSQMSLAGPDRDELLKAEQEYQAAISMSDPVNPADYFRLGEIRSMLGKVDEAIVAFTKAGELGPALKPFADRSIEDLKKQRR